MRTNRRKSPTIAGLLSGLMPGLGQLYCRQWAKGAGCVAAVLVIDASTHVSEGLLDFWLRRVVPPSPTQFLLGATLVGVIAAWSVFDAVRTAKRSSA
jgi:hypothetical protein